MSRSHKYIDKKWKNGRWVYYYDTDRFNPNNIREVWRIIKDPYNDDDWVEHPGVESDYKYEDEYNNTKIVKQTPEAARRNMAGLAQNYSVNEATQSHREKFLKEKQTYVDRRNKAGKRQNRSGEAVKASYKTTPVSKIKSTFRRISSRLGNIKLSSIFK